MRLSKWCHRVINLFTEFTDLWPPCPSLTGCEKCASLVRMIKIMTGGGDEDGNQDYGGGKGDYVQDDGWYQDNDQDDGWWWTFRSIDLMSFPRSSTKASPSPGSSCPGLHHQCFQHQHQHQHQLLNHLNLGTNRRVNWRFPPYEASRLPTNWVGSRQ